MTVILLKASVDDPFLSTATADEPDEIVHGHRSVVVGVATNEMFGANCVAFGVFDRVDLVVRHPNLSSSALEVWKGTLVALISAFGPTMRIIIWARGTNEFRN